MNSIPKTVIFALFVFLEHCLCRDIAFSVSFLCFLPHLIQFLLKSYVFKYPFPINTLPLHPSLSILLYCFNFYSLLLLLKFNDIFFCLLLEYKLKGTHFYLTLGLEERLKNIRDQNSCGMNK